MNEISVSETTQDIFRPIETPIIKESSSGLDSDEIIELGVMILILPTIRL